MTSTQTSGQCAPASLTTNEQSPAGTRPQHPIRPGHVAALRPLRPVPPAGLPLARGPGLQELPGLPLDVICPGCGQEELRGRVRHCWRCLLTGEVKLDHTALDSLPASRTVEYLRELLIANGALSSRDRHLATFKKWSQLKLAMIPLDEHRSVIERFIRWDVERKLRQQAHDGEVTTGAFLRAKQRVTVAIQFLAWLGDQGRTLTECSQHDIDKWLSTGTTTRWHSTPFIWWARKLPVLVAGPR